MSESHWLNAAIEIHDSTLTALLHRESDIVVSLRAYVHRSNGRPGRDPGAGFTQPVEFVFVGGKAIGPPPSGPIRLSDGSLAHEAGVLDNLIPLPFTASGPVTLNVVTTAGERLNVSGLALEVRSTGAATYVEDVP